MDREKQIQRLLSNPGLLPVQRAVLKKFDRECEMNDSLAPSTRAGQLFRLVPLAVYLKKPFEAADRNDVEEFLYSLEIERSTLDLYKISIKKFFKWLYKSETYPDAVKWIKVANHKKRMLPDDILTPAEVKAMIDSGSNPRDRAFVSLLYESAARIEEAVVHERVKNKIIPVKQKDLVFDQYGAVIILTGKTGMRRIRLIRCVPDLIIWLNHHPLGRNADAPLWVGLHEPHEYLSASRAYSLICSIAEKAKISKNVYPHLLRHTRLTEVAGYFKDSDLKYFAGWTLDSKMASVYIHRSGADIERVQLEAEGIITKEEANKQSDVLKPRVCSRCRETNPATARFCYTCGIALDIETAVKIDKVDAEVMLKLVDVIKKQPHFLDLLEAFKRQAFQ